MIRTATFCLVAAIALVAPATARAQDTGGENAAIPGRNAALKAAFKDVAAKASRSVVSLSNGDHQGYGVILPGGIIATSAALVPPDASEVEVKANAQSGTARVLGVDADDAVAFLEAPFDTKDMAIEMGKSGDLLLGEFVIGVGTKSDEPLCVGVLSAKERRVEPNDLSQMQMFAFSDDASGPKRAYPKVLQHDAPLADDMLGSPLVDSQGRLIGLNVGTGYRGSSFAFAVDDLLSDANSMKAGKTAPRFEAPAHEEPKRAYLGVTLTPKDGGLVVFELAADGPAATAGLLTGDRLVNADGKKTLDSLESLGNYIAGKKPGDKIAFLVDRGGKQMTVTVTLGEQ